MLQPLGAALRRLYDSGWLVRDKLSLPSLCVGNAGFGGAGKTPVAQYLASRLLAQRRVPALVMRGYGGDEEWESAVRVPRALVAVGRDRPAALAGAMLSCEQSDFRIHAPDAAILDDGFQHAGLATDLRLLVVNSGSGGLTGRETLRSAASRADMVVLHQRAAFDEVAGGGDAGDAAILDHLASKCGNKPVVRTRLRSEGWIPAAQAKALRRAAAGRMVQGVSWTAFLPSALPASRGDAGLPPSCRVAVVVTGTAGARPVAASLHDAAEREGCLVVASIALPDHAPWTQRRVARVSAAVQRAAAEAGVSPRHVAVLTTEKDCLRHGAEPWLATCGCGGVFALRVAVEPVDAHSARMLDTLLANLTR